MSSYKPIDSKREEFRKYLEKCGLMDVLTQILVELYEKSEKPTDALEFVRVHLSDSQQVETEQDECVKENEELKAKLKLAEENMNMYKERLMKYENVSDDPQVNENHLDTQVEEEHADKEAAEKLPNAPADDELETPEH